MVETMDDYGVVDLGMTGISPLVPLLERSPPLDLDRIDHVALERRQEASIITELVNGAPGKLNIEFGKIQHWRISTRALATQPEYVQEYLKKQKEKEQREAEEKEDDDRGLRKRQQRDPPKEYKIYVTFNTCLQPQPNTTALDNPSEAPIPPPLELYVSNSTNNKRPGPTYKGRDQFKITVEQGFANFTTNITSDWYISVMSPNITRESERRQWRGVWNYELAVSTWGQFHGLSSRANVYLVDSDSDSALLITGNMTDPREYTHTPYVLYAQNTAQTAAFRGLEKSYCAVSRLAQVGKASVVSSITTRGLGNRPKQQFHITGLNQSTLYYGYLARPGNVSMGGSQGGGVLWDPMNIETKSDGNCQVVFDLPFCSEVAYAVPSNPTKFNSFAIGQLYDKYAESLFKNFSYSLQQIPCNTTSTSRYSLARNCDDCDKAYKTWLCAVAIPRCADFSNNDTFLAPRALNTQFWNASEGKFQRNIDAELLLNVTSKEETALQRSRNPIIEAEIQPGPYKEIKPCLDLCYSLVQSCPSDFGFTCPKMGSFAQMGSYGQRSDDGDITCSYLGAVYFLSIAAVPKISGYLLWLTVGMSLMLTV